MSDDNDEESSSSQAYACRQCEEEDYPLHYLACGHGLCPDCLVAARRRGHCMVCLAEGWDPMAVAEEARRTGVIPRMTDILEARGLAHSVHPRCDACGASGQPLHILHCGHRCCTACVGTNASRGCAVCTRPPSSDTLIVDDEFCFSCHDPLNDQNPAMQVLPCAHKFCTLCINATIHNAPPPPTCPQCSNHVHGWYCLDTDTGGMFAGGAAVLRRNPSPWGPGVIPRMTDILEARAVAHGFTSLSGVHDPNPERGPCFVCKQGTMFVYRHNLCGHMSCRECTSPRAALCTACQPAQQQTGHPMLQGLHSLQSTQALRDAVEDLAGVELPPATEDACFICKRTDQNLSNHRCGHYSCSACSGTLRPDDPCATCRASAPAQDHSCQSCHCQLDAAPATHMAMVPCGHLQCTRCARAMLTAARLAHEEAKCPLCREAVTAARVFQWTHPEIPVLVVNSAENMLIPQSPYLSRVLGSDPVTVTRPPPLVTAILGRAVASPGTTTTVRVAAVEAESDSSLSEPASAPASSSSADSRREQPATGLTLEELKLASLPEGNPDWICAVCSAPYDNGKHVPVRVTDCFKEPPSDYYMPTKREIKEDKRTRGSEDPCEHKTVLCLPCAKKLDEDYQHNACPICKKWIKTTAPDLELLTEIISRHGGEYVALVRQLNDVGDLLGSFDKKIASAEKERDKALARIGDVEVQSSRVNEVTRALAKAQADVRSLQNTLEQAQRNVELLKQFREDKLKAERILSERDKICGQLFEELIDTRIRLVTSGVLAPDQLDIELAATPGSVRFAGGEDARVYTITLGNRQRLQYAAPNANFENRDEENRLRVVRAFNASANGNAVALPTLKEMQSSHWTAATSGGSSVIMVKVNTWLHCWLRRNMAAESLFDSPAFSTDSVDMEARYVPVNQTMMARAQEAYEEFRNKPPPSAAVAKSIAPVYIKEIPRATCCVSCFKQHVVLLCKTCGYHWCSGTNGVCMHACDKMEGHGGCGEDPKLTDYVEWARRLFVAMYLVMHREKATVWGFVDKLKKAGQIPADCNAESFTTLAEVATQLSGLLAVPTTELPAACHRLLTDVLATMLQVDTELGLAALQTRSVGKCNMLAKALLSKLRTIESFPSDVCDVARDNHWRIRKLLDQKPDLPVIVEALKHLRDYPQCCNEPIPVQRIAEWANDLLGKLDAPLPDSSHVSADDFDPPRCIYCTMTVNGGIPCHMCNYQWCGACPHWCPHAANVPKSRRGQYGELISPQDTTQPLWSWIRRLWTATGDTESPSDGDEENGPDECRAAFWEHAKTTHRLRHSVIPRTVDQICMLVKMSAMALMSNADILRPFCYSLVDKWLTRQRRAPTLRTPPARASDNDMRPFALTGTERNFPLAASITTGNIEFVYRAPAKSSGGSNVITPARLATRTYRVETSGPIDLLSRTVAVGDAMAGRSLRTGRPSLPIEAVFDVPPTDDEEAE